MRNSGRTHDLKMHWRSSEGRKSQIPSFPHNLPAIACQVPRSPSRRNSHHESQPSMAVTDREDGRRKKEEIYQVGCGRCVILVLYANKILVLGGYWCMSLGIRDWSQDGKRCSWVGVTCHFRIHRNLVTCECARHLAS